MCQSNDGNLIVDGIKQFVGIDNSHLNIDKQLTGTVDDVEIVGEVRDISDDNFAAGLQPKCGCE